MLRISIGFFMVCIGLGVVGLSLYWMLQGQFLWLVLGIAGGAATIAGVRVAQGERIKAILRDLLFVFVRTH